MVWSQKCTQIVIKWVFENVKLSVFIELNFNLSMNVLETYFKL